MKKAPAKCRIKISDRAYHLMIAGGNFLIAAITAAAVLYLFFGTAALEIAGTLLTIGLKGTILATAAAMICDLTYLKNKNKE